MNDAFSHMVREILPRSDFILVETLACVCKDFTRFPADFRRVHCVEHTDCDSRMVNMHGATSRYCQQIFTAYGYMLYSSRFGLTRSKVRSFDIILKKQFNGMVSLTIRPDGLEMVRLYVDPTKPPTVTEEEIVNASADCHALEKYRMIKEVLAARTWRVDAETAAILSRKLLRLHLQRQ